MAIIRPFNAYGPRLCGDEYGQVIAMFFQQLINQNSLNIHGDGSQTRSFTWIDDIVDGFLLPDCVTYPLVRCSISVQEEISVELAEKIASYGDSATLNFVEGYNGDVNRRLPNIEKSLDLLDWQPSVCLDDGLQKMWQLLTS